MRKPTNVQITLIVAAVAALVTLAARPAIATPSAQKPFVHPGLISTQADFDRMKAQVGAGAHPWIDSYKILASNGYVSLSFKPHPQKVVTRPGNAWTLWGDVAAAYQDTLMWKITGDTRYADKAVEICNAWSSTLEGFSSNGQGWDYLLACGLQGYEFANAGENLYGYQGWSDADRKQFQHMMSTVFYITSHQWMEKHYGACPDNAFANWDLIAVANIMAIGVVCDDRDKYNEALGYLRTSNNTPANLHWWAYHVFPGNLAQQQESGRDQGHAGLGIGLVGNICQMAWSQGDDLFGFENNRFLAAAEYFSKYNLGNDVPFSHYQNCNQSIQAGVSGGGRGDMRPVWALIYNHYANVVGVACPWTKQYADKSGVDGGGGNCGPNSGGYDQLGFTTLTCTLPPYQGHSAPTGLWSDATGPFITLSWWGSVNASGHKIARATNVEGPYTLLSGDLKDSLYIDETALPGVTYYYVVASVFADGASMHCKPLAVTVEPHITGTVIGTKGSAGLWNGSYNTGMTKEAVFDGNSDGVHKFFDGPDANGDWVGLDVGDGFVVVPTKVSYQPRSGQAGRMVGGKIQGSNTPDFSSGVETLYTIATAPPDGTMTTAAFDNNRAFRYIRYLSPNNGFCNVCELAFFGSPAANGTYRIVNRKTGLALHLSAVNNTTVVDQQAVTVSANLKWSLTNVGNGQFEIANESGGVALSAGRSQEARLQVRPYTNMTSQHFALVATNSGYYRIASVQTGKPITVKADGTIALGDWSGGDSDQWKLEAP